MTVTKDITIGELLTIDMSVIPVLMDIGMFCVGCPASQGETIGEAAMVHGIDPDELVEEINKCLARSEAEAAEASTAAAEGGEAAGDSE